MYSIYINGIFHREWELITNAIGHFNALCEEDYGMVELFGPTGELILSYHE